MNHPPRLDRVSPDEPPSGGAVVFHRSWPSRADLREDVLEAVGRVLLDGGWVAAPDHAWLRLCLDEAVTNAMYHGNEGDPRLTVTVVVQLDERYWTVLVADQGQGFEPGMVPGQDTIEDLQREHGRGIRLMQEWLEVVDYWRGGRLARLRRRRADRRDAPG